MLLLHILAVRTADVLLAPRAVLQGVPAALLWLQGAGLKADQYKNLALLVQQQAKKKGIALWIGIPQFVGSFPQPNLIRQNIDRIYQGLLRLQLPANATVFGAGHSAGGAFMADYVLKDNTFFNKQKKFSGVVLMGSFVARSANKTWSLPALQIAGEVDGMCRITRMAEAYLYQFKNKGGINNQSAIKNYPVIVIQGGSHMQFSQGQPTLLIKQRDIKPFVPLEQSHGQISKYLAQFLWIQISQKETSDIFRAKVLSSSALFQTILQAYELQGNYNILPPCNCDNPLTPPYGRDPFGYVNFYPCMQGTYKPDTCRTGSLWGQLMQKQMGGLTNISYNITSAFHPVQQTKPNSNLPYIFNNCSVPNINCNLTITTVNQNIYEADQDTGFPMQSSIEIRAKMSSRQKVMIMAGIPHPDFNQTDGPQNNLCGYLNNISLQWALSKLPDTITSRYRSVGQLMEFGQDDKKSGGPGWIDTHLQFKTVGQKMVVSSPTVSFPEPFTLEISAGLHYCKLLSPARAVEWVMLDSLRLKNSLKINEQQ